MVLVTRKHVFGGWYAQYVGLPRLVLHMIIHVSCV